MSLSDSHDSEGFLKGIIFNSLMQTCSFFYPQGHLEFDGGGGTGVLEREALSQCHALLRQQIAQRHSQISKGAFALVIFHLHIETEERASGQDSCFHPQHALL